MAKPQFEADRALGQELLVGISILSADALKRSGLLELVLSGSVMYSTVEFSRDHTPNEEISLFLGIDEYGNHIVILSENPRVLDNQENTFELGPMTSIILQKDGLGFAPRHEESRQDMSLTEATEYIIRRLPDFTGAVASIEVLAGEKQ